MNYKIYFFQISKEDNPALTPLINTIDKLKGNGNFNFKIKIIIKKYNI